MSLRSRALLGAGLVAVAIAPAAEARVAADACHLRPAKFKLTRLSAPPASVQAGSQLRMSGRVANLRGRRSETGRITFSLRRGRPARRVARLRAIGTQADRSKGQNVRLTRGGKSRRFVVRLLVPRTVPAGRYRLRACVRRGSGTNLGSCRSRALRVTRRPAQSPPPTAPPTSGGGAGPGAPGGPPHRPRTSSA